MSNGLVEKYEQILENDPGSLVFVELAKALLDRGAPGKAIDVCARGMEHHPESVTGRVLWGKALIICGRPTEALAQFDAAISIDRENPTAYNLIGEVLVHKGLYRSALPILRKAVALQPTDPRVRQWLEQAQRSVSRVTVSVRAPTPDELPPPPPESRGSEHPAPNPQCEGTAAEPVPPHSRIEGVDVLPFPPSPPPSDPAANPELPRSQLGGALDTLDIELPPSPQPENPGAEPPLLTLPPLEDTNSSGIDWAAGLPGESDGESPASSRSAETDMQPEATPAGRAPEPESFPPPAKTLELLPALDAVPASSEPVPEPAPPPLSAAAPALSDDGAPELHSPPPPGQKLELLPALIEPPSLEPVPEPAPPPLAASAPAPNLGAPKVTARAIPILTRTRRPRREDPPARLLPELPSLPPTASADVQEDAPEVVIAPDAAADIAREYERELREKLLAAPPLTFWRQHWLSLSGAAALAIAVVGGIVIYKGTRAQNLGTDLISLRSQSYRALALQTPPGYRHAIELAKRALALSPDDLDSKAALSYANAALYRFFDQEDCRSAATEPSATALQERHPGFALALPYLTAAEPAASERAKAALLATPLDPPTKGFEGAEVHSLAGRALLAAGKTEQALGRFKAALDADPAHVGTLVALGEYYLSQDESEEALKWLTLAKAASPEHVGALLRLISAKVALGVEGKDIVSDFETARSAMSATARTPAAWPAAFETDLDLAEGRVLAAQGRLPDAEVKLAVGATDHPDRAPDFYAALGSIEVLGGNYDRAESAYRNALERRPTDASLREQLARALIARGKDLEAIKVTDGFADDRHLRIVRGLARLNLGQHAKARDELMATARNQKVPAEAAIYLALIDAATGKRDFARTVLESAVKSAKGRGGAHVALGKVLLESGREEEAFAEFAAAEADRRDWEGACSLGRIHLKAARFADAQRHLATAVQRNASHVEARLALGQTLLALGEAAKAQAALEAVLAQAPTAAAYRGLARATLAQGNLASARAHLQKATKLEPRDQENARLAAQIALAAGDAQDAVKNLDTAAKASPRDPVAWCELGETLLKVGNTAAAAKAFETALKNDSGNPRARLGLVASALPKQAKRVLKESDALVAELEKNPVHRARALALAARVRLALADKTRAAALAKRAVEADDASADAHLARALVANALRDDDAAIRELSRVIAVDPTIAEAHLALAVSLARDPTTQLKAISEIDAYLRIAPKGPDAASARKLLASLQKKADKETLNEMSLRNQGRDGRP